MDILKRAPVMAIKKSQEQKINLGLGESLKAFGIYVAAGVLTIVICGYAVISREHARPARDVVPKAQRALDAARADFESVSAQPKLPPLTSSWTKARFLADACGVDWITEEATAAEVAGDYTGPASNWRATLKGPPAAVFACADLLIKNFPVWPGTFNLSGPVIGGSATLRFSVLGSLPQS